MVDDRSREIAVVDDDTAVLESFRFMLELAGFRVATYLSGITFLASDVTRPRCVILDQHMPLMTGLELTARLRADGLNIPILLITSSPSPAIIARAAALGIERVLEKPPAEDDLVDFVTVREDGIDVVQRCRPDIGRTLPSTAKPMASSRSRRVPTIEPRMVIRLSTTSKIGVGNSPGGRPTRLTVPLRRTKRSACEKAYGETAVTRTPWAPRRWH
jgi:two-component system response regulator FixJ